MSSAAVLASLEQLGGTLSETYVVGAQPFSVEQRIEFSPTVEAAFARGAHIVLRLLAELEVG